MLGNKQAGFRSKASVARVIKAARDVERIRTETFVAPQGVGGTGGPGLVTVELMSLTKSDDMYHGRYVFRNEESLSTGDRWLEYPEAQERDAECYVEDVNGADLRLGVRYVGWTVGVLERFDGDGNPIASPSNGFPLVLVLKASDSGGGETTPGGCEGCEWTAGLTQTDCLRATVIEGRGACNCPDSVLNTPAGMFSVDGTTWITPQIVTPEQPESHLTVCGMDYGVTFTREACDGPCLTLTARSSSQETYTTVRGCCGCNYAVFGVRLPTCDATGNPCGPCQNLVRIRVEWVPCNPIISEDGWYCIKPVGALGVECAPVELLFSEDACRSDIEICSGPHATREEAEAFCGTFVTGGASCAATVAIPVNEWRRGYLGPFPQPTQYFCVPVTAGQTYKMHASATSLSLSEGLRVTVFWATNECGTLVDGIPAANFGTSSPPSSPSCHNIGTAPTGATRMCVAVRHEYTFSDTEFNIRVSTGSC